MHQIIRAIIFPPPPTLTSCQGSKGFNPKLFLQLDFVKYVSGLLNKSAVFVHVKKSVRPLCWHWCHNIATMKPDKNLTHGHGGQDRHPIKAEVDADPIIRDPVKRESIWSMWSTWGVKRQKFDDRMGMENNIRQTKTHWRIYGWIDFATALHWSHFDGILSCHASRLGLTKF